MTILRRLPRARALARTGLFFLCVLGLPRPSVAAGEQGATIDHPTPTLDSVVQPQVALGGPLTLKIKDLAAWAKEHTDRNLTKLILYLDDHPLDGLVTGVDLEQGTVRFELRRTDTTRDSWCEILGKKLTWHRPVTITTGFRDGWMVPSQATTELTVVQDGYVFCASLIIFLFSIVAFFWLVVISNIIRDGGPEPPAPKRRPFSLARTQMAVWFFLVLGSYLLIWVVTGDRDTIPASVLALIGISAGTGLGAVVLDGGKRNAANLDLQSLKAEEEALQGRIDQLTAAASAATDDQKRELAEKTARRTQIQSSIAGLDAAVEAAESQDFFIDILSDADGISFHRFQIAVWTVTLGLLFATSVWQGLTMPDFSNQLLGLMGISAGTYIGFKFPEKQT